MKKHIFYLLSAAVCLLAGCTENLEIPQSEIISRIICNDKLNAPCMGGTFSIEVDSSISWKASTAADWIALSPADGQAGKSTLSVEIKSQSFSEESRQGEIILTNAKYKVSHTITVTQTSVSQVDDNCKIIYTNNSNWPLYFGNEGPYFNANIIGDLYENGRGIFIFDEPVTSINDNAFNFIVCRSLTSITLPDSVTKIGESAFACCNNLTRITLSDGLTEIGTSALSFCSSLTSITLPDGVTKIGWGAFGYCDNLTSIIIPDGVTEIEGSTFNSCSSLTRITLPDGVTKIGESAFGYCSSLTSITLPDGLTEIGKLAFNNCSSLTRITIPDSVIEIGSNVFWYCSSLTTVYCRSQNPPSLGGISFDGTPSNLKIYVPRASVDKYKSASGWSRYSSQIVGYDF